LIAFAFIILVACSTPARSDCPPGALFQDGVPYTAGPQAHGIVTTDLNGDGILDVVVVSSLGVQGSPSGSIAVYLGHGSNGTGDGTFSTPAYFAANNYPTDVAAADLDGDGYTDLVVACAFADVVITLKGNGDGTFAPAVAHATGHVPFGLRVADFDGDGVPDIAVTNNSASSISVFAGVRTAGVFDVGPRHDYTVGAVPLGLTSGDFNGDGIQDLAVAVYNPGVIVELDGIAPGGTFGAAINHPIGAHPWNVAATDVNLDGRPDLVASTGDNVVCTLLGAPGGGFLSPLTSMTAGVTTGIVLADFDLDGVLDVALTNVNSTSVSVLLGNHGASGGNGTFTSAGSSEVGSQPIAITSADFNGDGHPDLATATFASGQIVVLLSGCTPHTPPSLIGQWQARGVLVTQASGDQLSPCIAADDVGGTFVAWLDKRPAVAGQPGPGIFVQRLTSAGTVAAGWPAGGLPVSQGGGESVLSITQDTAGGIFLTWLDSINGARVVRVTASGQLAPGWTLGGILTSSLGAAGCPSCYNPLFQGVESVADGLGGVFVAFASSRYIVVEHVMPNGLLDPSWGPDGLLFGPSNLPLGNCHIATDMNGGLYLVWLVFSYPCLIESPYTCFDDSRIERRHISSAGVVDPAWSGSEGAIRPRLASDGAGGAVVVRSNLPAPYSDSYVVRYDPTGSKIYDVNEHTNITVAGEIIPKPDGQGGTLLLWQAYYGRDFFTLRLAPNGAAQGGWLTPGASLGSHPAATDDAAMAPDGAGGACYAWADGRNSQYDVYATRLTSGGTLAPGWTANGDPVADGLADQSHVAIARDIGGSFVVCWQDHRNGTDYDVYAQRLTPDSPVATTTSLISADATQSSVTLSWQSSGDPVVGGVVQRRQDGTPWTAIGFVNSDGTGRMRFEDASVAPGARYVYRLGYRSDGQQLFTTETWVDVPLAAVLSLEGVRPNPAVDRMTVSFSLANGSPAALVLVDLAGRALLRRDVGSMGAGRHVVSLDAGTRLAPGMYWLRLTQGGRMLHARAVVIR
jgi:hypothetical protein